MSSSTPTALPPVAVVLAATDSFEAPWTVVLSNDQRRARLNTFRSVLARFDYEARDEDNIGRIDDRIVLGARAFLAAGV